MEIGEMSSSTVRTKFLGIFANCIFVRFSTYICYLTLLWSRECTLYFYCVLSKKIGPFLDPFSFIFIVDTTCASTIAPNFFLIPHNLIKTQLNLTVAIKLMSKHNFSATHWTCNSVKHGIHSTFQDLLRLSFGNSLFLSFKMASILIRNFLQLLLWSNEKFILKVRPNYSLLGGHNFTLFALQ